MKRTRAALLGAALASVLAVAACGSSSGGSPLSSTGGSKAPSDSIVVGSANFPENVVLADIYADALSAKGVKVSTKLNIGSREVYIPALKDHSIDLIPEYSGVLLQYFQPSATQVSSDDVYAALKSAVPSGLEVLDQSTAQDTDAVVVTAATAHKYHLTSIGDLKSVAKHLTYGGPPELTKRPTGLPGLKAKYGVVFGSFKALDPDGPLTVAALRSGRVQAADVFSTDPTIPKYNWVLLKDPAYLFAAQNVLPLINTSKATPTVTAALNAVSAKLTTQTLQALRQKVELDKQDPDTVAKAWLASQGLS